MFSEVKRSFSPCQAPFRFGCVMTFFLMAGGGVILAPVAYFYINKATFFAALGAAGLSPFALVPPIALAVMKRNRSLPDPLPEEDILATINSYHPEDLERAVRKVGVCQFKKIYLLRNLSHETNLLETGYKDGRLHMSDVEKEKGKLLFIIYREGSEHRDTITFEGTVKVLMENHNATIVNLSPAAAHKIPYGRLTTWFKTLIEHGVDKVPGTQRATDSPMRCKAVSDSWFGDVASEIYYLDEL